jgi:heme A synthase
MSAPVCIVFAFTGPSELLVFVHPMLAVLSYLSWKGLSQRRRWARWLSIVLSFVGILIFCLGIVQSIMVGNLEPAFFVFLLFILLFSVSLLWTMRTPEAGSWFAK